MIVVGNMGILVLILLMFLFCLKVPSCYAQEEHRASSFSSHRTVIDVKDGPESVVWVVQLSDLHFSVHHPDRAVDFKNLVPPALSMINPSLVLITGDLTGLKFLVFPFNFDNFSWMGIWRFSFLSISFMKNHDPAFWVFPFYQLTLGVKWTEMNTRNS